jgi:hypothetical protein
MDKRKTKILTRLHLTLLGALLVLIISTPFLVDEGISIFDEEVVESIMILFLIGLSLSVFALYQREIRRKEQSLAQFTRHVGALNLQIEQIRLLCKDIEESFETGKNRRDAITKLADRVLGIVNAAWVVLRIIELESGRTVTECARGRGKTDWSTPEISNRKLLENASLDDYSVICSGQDYPHLRAFCMLPVKEITKVQSVLIRVILDNLSMLYVVSTSTHLQK